MSTGYCCLRLGRLKPKAYSGLGGTQDHPTSRSSMGTFRLAQPEEARVNLATTSQPLASFLPAYSRRTRQRLGGFLPGTAWRTRSQLLCSPGNASRRRILSSPCSEGSAPAVSPRDPFYFSPDMLGHTPPLLLCAHHAIRLAGPCSAHYIPQFYPRSSRDSPACIPERTLRYPLSTSSLGPDAPLCHEHSARHQIIFGEVSCHQKGVSFFRYSDNYAAAQ